jgi:hypothetical protein
MTYGAIGFLTLTVTVHGDLGSDKKVTVNFPLWPVKAFVNVNKALNKSQHQAISIVRCSI